VVHQFHLEHQIGVRRDVARALRAIALRRRHAQAVDRALRQQLQPFGKARDHAAHGERGLHPLIEHRAGRGDVADVVDQHEIVLGRLRAVGGLEHGIAEARRRLQRAGALAGRDHGVQRQRDDLPCGRRRGGAAAIANPGATARARAASAAEARPAIAGMAKGRGARRRVLMPSL
jgi:hypothetical protein